MNNSSFDDFAFLDEDPAPNSEEQRSDDDLAHEDEPNVHQHIEPSENRDKNSEDPLEDPNKTELAAREDADFPLLIAPTHSVGDFEFDCQLESHSYPDEARSLIKQGELVVVRDGERDTKEIPQRPDQQQDAPQLETEGAESGKSIPRKSKSRRSFAKFSHVVQNSAQNSVLQNSKLTKIAPSIAGAAAYSDPDEQTAAIFEKTPEDDDGTNRALVVINELILKAGRTSPIEPYLRTRTFFLSMQNVCRIRCRILALCKLDFDSKSSSKAKQRLYDAHIRLCEAYTRADMTEMAIKHCAGLLDKDLDGRAHLFLGISLLKQHRLSSAFDTIQIALSKGKLNPNLNGFSFRQMQSCNVAIMEEQGKLTEAIRSQEQVLEVLRAAKPCEFLKQEKIIALQVAARLYYKIGKMSTGLALLREALELLEVVGDENETAIKASIMADAAKHAMTDDPEGALGYASDACSLFEHLWPGDYSDNSFELKTLVCGHILNMKKLLWKIHFKSRELPLAWETGMQMLTYAEQVYADGDQALADCRDCIIFVLEQSPGVAKSGSPLLRDLLKRRGQSAKTRKKSTVPVQEPTQTGEKRSSSSKTATPPPNSGTTRHSHAPSQDQVSVGRQTSELE
ncbi:hypothetical protein BJ742DRAFT_904167 [Cladochytrium replicatum]|nr:hypothetical protein BJ742DRAFT_904167 [Cladochytrium replicatum]